MLMVQDRIQLRKDYLVGALERLCQSLEPTDAQYQQAKERYEGVGHWLAGGASAWLRNLVIYLQGSTAHRTVNRPIGRNEYDVDLVAHIPDVSSAIGPAALKAVVGERLRANGRYAPLLKEMPRCWRIDYANEFHLDITPSIPNPACSSGGELVPDRAVKIWCASNPKGYRDLFARRAALTPRMRLMESAQKQLRADIEPYPAALRLKGILRRTVQIAKRHRDHLFLDQDASLAPISIILTTLAARSYEYCVASSVYDNEFDLLCDVIRHMPASIESRIVAGQRKWFIWNETTTNENFAEKWNADGRRADAFWAWHGRALKDLEGLKDLDGLDRVSKNLRESFGSAPSDEVLKGLVRDVSTARAAGSLAVAPAVGLTVGTMARSMSVRANTFFGGD